MRPSAVIRLAALAAVVMAAVACSDDGGGRTDDGYCTAVSEHLAELNQPALATSDEIDATLGAWRTVADAAPIAIEPEWETMLAGMETAATVVPGDADSLQKVADTARAAEPAANRIISYTYQLCGATIGPVTPVTTTPAQVPPTTAD